jgi:hypothetical protein
MIGSLEAARPSLPLPSSQRRSRSTSTVVRVVRVRVRACGQERTRALGAEGCGTRPSAEKND